MKEMLLDIEPFIPCFCMHPDWVFSMVGELTKGFTRVASMGNQKKKLNYDYRFAN